VGSVHAELTGCEDGDGADRLPEPEGEGQCTKTWVRLLGFWRGFEPVKESFF